MYDSKYPHNSKRFASEHKKTHEEIISDIEYVTTIFPSTQEYFLYVPASPYYYLMTQKGYDLLQDYWTNQNIWNAAKTMAYTDKNGNIIADWSDFGPGLSNVFKNTRIEGENTMKTLEPHCKKLLDLWHEKSKTNICTASNTKFGELLKKDPLTQKIIQSLQTIRVQWGTEYPGEDNERQKQYEDGPGYYFEHWMDNYNMVVNNSLKFPLYSYDLKYITRSTATEKMFNLLKEKSEQKLEDLESKYAEILTQLKATETYEQEINILKAYGVLDYNGVISPTEADDLKIPLTLEE